MNHSVDEGPSTSTSSGIKKAFVDEGHCSLMCSGSCQDPLPLQMMFGIVNKKEGFFFSKATDYKVLVHLTEHFLAGVMACHKSVKHGF